MSIPLIINGATYTYPTDGDPPPWGNNATAWAVGVTNAILPKTGGLFQLTGVLDFGENYGIRIKDLIQNSPDPVASTGVFRFPQTSTIAWRNADNTADLQLGVNALNQLVLNDVPIGGGAGGVPGGVQQLLASDGAGGYYNVPYGSSGYLLQSTGTGTTWVAGSSIPASNGIAVGNGLPGTVPADGSYFFNTADQTLYWSSGGVWTAYIPAALISGQITTGQIQDSAITAVKIGAAAVTAAKTNIAALSATTGLLNPGTVDVAQLVANAVTNSAIADGAITAAKTALAALDSTTGDLNAAVVGNAQLVANAVQAVNIASGAVDASKTAIAAIDPSSGNLTANSVTAGSIATGAVVAGKIAANAVTASTIAANAVTASAIAAGAVTAGSIAAGAITAGTIAANAIVTSNIQAGQITALLMAANSVTAGSIAAGAVVAGAIAANAVTAGTIAAGAVVAASLAAGSVTATALAAGSVTTSALNVVIGGGNLMPDSSFEALASGGPTNRPLYYSAYNNAGISITYTRPTGRATGTFAYGLQANANTTNTFGLHSASNIDPSTGAGGGVQGLWQPNTNYVLSFYAMKTNGSGWSNMFLAWNTAPAVTTTVSNPNLSGSFQRYVFNLTTGSSVEPLGAIFISVNGTTTSGDVIIIDDLQVEQGDTVTGWSPLSSELLPGTIVANMLAANSVTAGTIAANAVTSGTIAANVITAGNMVTGLFSSDNVLTRGLTVRDNSGNILLAAGVNLPAANITPDPSWLNGNITINSNGTLSGAGGGSVTVSGLDNTIVRSANPITSSNVGTYIANAAISTAQIGSLNASVITAGTITTQKLQVGSVSASASQSANSATIIPFGGPYSGGSGTLTGPTLTTIGGNVIAGVSGGLTVFWNGAANTVYQYTCELNLVNTSTGVTYNNIGAYQTANFVVGKTTSISYMSLPVMITGMFPAPPAATYRLDLTVSILSSDASTGNGTATFNRVDAYDQSFIYEIKV